MKPTRNLWLWIALEVLVTFSVHWLLREKERGWAGPRAWWRTFASDEPNPVSTPLPLPPPSPDVCADYFRNQGDLIPL